MNNKISEHSSFPRVKGLPPYSLGKIANRVHELRAGGKDVIDCSQLNPALKPPQLAVDKLVQVSLLPHNHRYSASGGIALLRTAFTEYYKTKFNVEIDANQEIVVTQGTKEGIAHLLQAILNPGDTVLVPVPTYPVHTASVCLAGAGFVGVPLWKSFDHMSEKNGILTGDSEYFFTRLENRYFQTWPRPRILVTSFPHNPTTSIVTKCFYERLISFASLHNLFIVNDFAHGDLYFSQEDRCSILSLPHAKEVAVEFYSLSKGFSLPGWRIGCGAGNANLLNALKSVKSYIDFGIFQPLQVAASELLKYESSYDRNSARVDPNAESSVISDNTDLYRHRRDILKSILEQNGWNVISSRATPFIWCRLPEDMRSAGSQTVADLLLEKRHLACSPGQGFDSQQVDCMRFSLVESETRLREVSNRIRDFGL
ncbi:MAG TPA: aminotransferase class I/II-fold pyridoxal phosphate-dependent enzyme [Oligoflexia bacterium]|nr:aminotransferase class I/II-fold pyridoxal phosphate-dependent enzyme [Oligoflexia bacterium]HMP47670.1 aminotransferase class I/II-fold pyridoxal phosphate-dependent enzyme [Oligoflexia bacterium]